MVRSVGKAGQAQPRLSSVANSVLLLKAFLDEQAELSFSALAAHSGMSRSTVHRLIWTLTEAGMLERNKDTGKYRLGIALFELASLARPRMDVSFESRPWLLTLREQTGEAVSLSVLEREGVVCVNFLESTAGDVSSRIGSCRPAHCTAEGKALIAFQPPVAAAERGGEGNLQQHTPRTVVDPVALREELATVRVNGYAIEDEEYELGVRGIAAPIKDGQGNAVAAVGITGPTQRLTRPRLFDLARFLIATANGIERKMRPVGS
jgi:IclR family KDG regulon transcriptional repressor